MDSIDTMSSPSPVTVTRIPRPDEPVPGLSLPGAAVFAAGIAILAASTALALAGAWPWAAAVGVNAVACYLLFTVAHDASHHSLSSHEGVNVWLGRIATFLFAPQAGFRSWRFIHMQHHRFTNHDDGSDPDAYTMAGPSWQRPLRWLTVDLQYVVFFMRYWKQRPRADKIELLIQDLVVVAVIAASALTGHFVDLVLLVALPQRLAIVWLAYAFDYLPHHGLHHKPSEDRLKTTRNRVGGERVLSPLLLYQNYHLVHHLHPIVPFYRYLAVWRRNEDRYLEGDPALSTVRGRPLTSDEYRELRKLAAHEH